MHVGAGRVEAVAPEPLDHDLVRQADAEGEPALRDGLDRQRLLGEDLGVPRVHGDDARAEARCPSTSRATTREDRERVGAEDLRRPHASRSPRPSRRARSRRRRRSAGPCRCSCRVAWASSLWSATGSLPQWRSPERTDHPATPRRVGIVGAGQLARMLCEAASALGSRTVVLAAHADDAATQVAGDVTLVGSPADPAALAALADGAATSSPSTTSSSTSRPSRRSRPRASSSARGPDARIAAVDKAAPAHDGSPLRGFPSRAFDVLDGDASGGPRARCASFADALGEAPVVKAARGGYDGRGVVVATDSLDEAVDAVARWRARGVAVVAEGAVRRSAPSWRPSSRAGRAARSRSGARSRPTSSTACAGRSASPAPSTTPRRADAAALARSVAEHLGVVGVLAVELFDTADGLVVNEVAAAPAQLGPLDDRGRDDLAVREPPSRRAGPPARRHRRSSRPPICSVNVFGAPSGATPRRARRRARRADAPRSTSTARRRGQGGNWAT